jgi:hypothetical protein
MRDPTTTILSKAETLACGIPLHRILGSDAVDALKVIGTLSGIHELGAPTSSSRTRKRHGAFPGPNPVSIERADFHKLNEQPYAVTEKTDGVRMLMCMYRTPSMLDVCVVMDRATSTFLFPIQNTPKPLFQGTLLDGELVFDLLENVWTYLIFDAVCVCGVPVFQFPFSKRMHAVSTALKAYVPRPHHDAGILVPKKFLPLQKEMVAQMEFHVANVQKRYPTDGVIFMPEFDQVKYGRHDNLLKLKQKHSVDFIVKGGRLAVYDEAAKRNKVIGNATGPGASGIAEGDIVECLLDTEQCTPDKPTHWRVLLVRKDKQISNTKYTMEKTLLNMVENLTFASVVQSVFDRSHAGNPIWE